MNLLRDPISPLQCSPYSSTAPRLVTTSGLSLAGIVSAFWGLLAGVVTLLVLRRT